jgi:hypothetical protein
LKPLDTQPLRFIAARAFLSLSRDGEGRSNPPNMTGT